MSARELFPAIQDENARSQILERLCTIKRVITTIHTLLEDTKYLEPCVRILKKILPGKSKGSLSQYFKGLHNGQHNTKVQTTDYTSEDRTPFGSHASWVAYRVLWLLTLRHFPEMDGQAPRKDIGKCSTWKPGLQPQWWIELSALALGNGYRRIRKLYRDRKAADSSEIEDCVRRIRPSMEQELRRRKVQLIYQIIGDPECPDTVTIAPELTSDHDNYRPELSDRCGRPRTSALLADKGFLFFDHIYSTLYDTTPKRYLTSFAITRDFFHSFFGTAEDDLDQPTSFRLPCDNHSGDREGEGRMQDVDDAEGPPANQRPAPPPPHEVPLPASPTRPVENTHSAVTTSGTPLVRNSRIPDGYRSGDTHIRETIFLGAVQQLLPAGPSTESTQTTTISSEHVSIEDVEMVPGAMQQLLPAGPSTESTQATTISSEDVLIEDVEMVPRAPPSAGQLVGKAHTAIASRSRSLDGRRKITQRGRSTSPTHHTHRSERQRSTSSHRERRQSRGSGTSRVQVEDPPAEGMEIVQWVPPPPTVAGPLVEHSHSAIIPSASALPAAQPSAAPIFSQDIRDRTVSALPDIQLSAAPMFMFSEETQDRNVSALPAAQPSAASMFVFSEETQDGTVSALSATQPTAASTPVLSQIQGRAVSGLLATQQSPMFISGQEQLIEDITISLQDASRFLFHRRKRTMTTSFMVLSLAGRDRFHVRKADPTNTVSMVDTLQIPSKETFTFVSDHGKRLKLIAPVTIIDKARDQKLGTALVVSKEKAGEIIRQLENSEDNSEELGEELVHKKPQPSLTVDEIIKRTGKPVRISIWEEGRWKNLRNKFTYDQTKYEVKQHMRRKGVRPYDYDGNDLTLEDCFHGVQKDSPPTVFLCLPEQASSAFEL